MKRILIFSTAYYPLVGGAEVAIKELTDRFESDFEFDLITAKLDKKLPSHEKIGRVDVYRIGGGNIKLTKILLPFLGAALVRKLEKKNEYHSFWVVMVSFAGGAAFISNIFRKLSGRKRIPIVLTLQEGDSEEHLKYKWAGLIALSWKLALRSTDILTGISNFLINRAKKNGYRGESVLVPNGVDVELFGKEISLNLKDKIKMKLNKNSGDIFLVTTGRLTHKNAIEDIISALTLLPENISLIVIGKGELGINLQNQAYKLGVLGRVKFLGFIPYGEIPDYFSVCDIFVRASRSEGFGNSFIEAMAAGLPVIATPVGGIVDFIDDKETGIFCSPDNPKSIAISVDEILGDPALRDRIVEKARNRVLERYSWDYISKQMENVFKEIE